MNIASSLLLLLCLLSSLHAKQLASYPPVLQAWARKELGETLARNSSRLPSVYVLSDHIPQSHFPRLYKSADCFVLPTR